MNAVPPASSARVAPLDAPFPWFGGKSRVAPAVWNAFGDVVNYVEPFFGSGAVLLGRPYLRGSETVNDLDGMVCNFFRAVKHAPQKTAEWADQPVNENDLHARHAWLISRRDCLTRQLEGDPEYYDPKIAGWWVWGICCWIGGGWCDGKGPWRPVDGKLVRQNDGGMGVKRRLPHIGDTGHGVNRITTNIYDWFAALSDRLRNVRVCCGDWGRVCGPSPTVHIGLTGVFLDPPYSAESNRSGDVYACDSAAIAHDVRKWCLENGDNRLMRIALCGYDGEHDELDDAGWRVHAWKAEGGGMDVDPTAEDGRTRVESASGSARTA